MRKLTLLMLAFALVAGAGSAFAVDRDNNGIVGDEPTYVPGHFEGVTDRDQSITFPTSTDTWTVSSYPYWWHVGDTVYGTHNVSPAATSVSVSLALIYNSLTSGCGYVDLDFRIAGTTVGTLHITAESGLGPVSGGPWPCTASGPVELRYYETNQVVGGCGSISLDDSGRSSVTFAGGGTPTDNSTWGKVKSLYR